MAAFAVKLVVDVAAAGICAAAVAPLIAAFDEAITKSASGESLWGALVCRQIEPARWQDRIQHCGIPEIESFLQLFRMLTILTGSAHEQHLAAARGILQLCSLSVDVDRVLSDLRGNQLAQDD